MKVIDLLNKIANGEIEANTELLYKKEKYRHIDNLFEHYYVEEILNNEIEVIEEDKKIEKLEYIVDEDGILFIDGFDDYREQKLQIVNKINEIIDKINKGD